MQPSYTDMAGNDIGGRSQPGHGPRGSSLSSGSVGKSEHWKHLTEARWTEERGEMKFNTNQSIEVKTSLICR